MMEAREHIFLVAIVKSCRIFESAIRVTFDPIQSWKMPVIRFDIFIPNPILEKWTNLEPIFSRAYTKCVIPVHSFCKILFCCREGRRYVRRDNPAKISAFKYHAWDEFLISCIRFGSIAVAFSRKAIRVFQIRAHLSEI